VIRTEIQILTDQDIIDIFFMHGIWKGMRNRCSNPNEVNYHRYGGRGIKVSKEWSNAVAFIRDMWPRPSPAHSIDRIDVNGNYEKSNCRWATNKEQNRNKRNTRYVIFKGKKICMSELAEGYGQDASRIINRIKNLGWTPDQAVGIEKRVNPLTTELTFDGVTLPFKEMAAKYGKSVVCLHKRLESGMPLSEALTRPIEARGGSVSLERVTVRGETNTIKHFAKKYGQELPNVYARRDRLGWTLEQALGLDPRPARTAHNKGKSAVTA
jgi:hypothetical protein